jgi:uncharacterized protein YkwD
LQIQMHNLPKNTLVRFGLGMAALLAATAASQAQTYYYYSPTYATTTAAATGTTSQPVYYVPSTNSNQTAWNGYSTQYYQAGYTNPVYQASYTPQYYQASYTQPTYVTQATQATTAGPQYVQTSYVQQASQPAAEAAPAQSTTETAAPATTAPAADAYGFTSWLNSTRAAYGLPAVGYDPNLESWAAMNSAQQASSGLGHFVMGPARRQNSAVGGFPGIESMWMASPAHRAALLDLTIRWIGIAGYGAYWTFNAY